MRVARMAWVEEMLSAAGGSQARLDELRKERDGAWEGIDATDIRDAVGVAQAPASAGIPPNIQAAITETLSSSISPEVRTPWNEHLLALVMIGTVDSAHFASAFDHWSKLGAPEYWGQIGPVDAALIAHGIEFDPEAGGGHSEWASQLATALLLRESRYGGFTSPVLAASTASATAGAVISLHYAGASGELEAYREILKRILCAPTPDTNDPRIRAALIGTAISLLDYECDPPHAPRGERQFDTWTYAIATGKRLPETACPPQSPSGGINLAAVLASTLALERDMRLAHVRGCAPAEALGYDDDSVAGVFDLYAISVLRMLGDYGLDNEQVLMQLSRFESIYGYGSEEASLSETCQAMVLKALLSEGELLEIICLT